jgi:3-hydroxy-9,10-secoandrosta-1,3,5(10)-triene-9,17-dione monooxygenase
MSLVATPSPFKVDPPSGTEIIARAEAIAARLTARGSAAEQAGRLPDATIQEVIDAGLMRTTVPKRFGGSEIDYRYVPAIQRALGRGCLATSWTIGIQIQHNYQLGFYSRELQEEVWANGPDTFVPGYIIPGGTAKVVPGGFRLSGHWRFGSGFPHGSWILLTALELVNGEKGAPRRFALPIADCTPQNNWKISGLAATGTWDCVLDDVFVPAHRSILAAGLLDGSAPGAAINTGPMWRIPMMAFYYPNMSAMMLGAAEGAYRLAVESTKKRVLSYGGAKAAGIDHVRINTGRQKVRLNAIGALLEADAARVQAMAESQAPFTLEDRVAIRANCTYVTKQSREIVNEICDQAGTQAFMLANDLQRFNRELAVLSSHAFYDVDRMNLSYGQVMLEGTLPAGEMA